MSSGERPIAAAKANNLAPRGFGKAQTHFRSSRCRGRFVSLLNLESMTIQMGYVLWYILCVVSKTTPLLRV